MTTEAVVTGWGFYVPPKVLTNADLETIVDTTDAWIYERTGIRERHIVEGDEVTSVMATKAAKEALARAGVRGEDLDAIVVATTSPDYLLPTAACLVQESLGARRAAVFDLGAACAGFIYGLAVSRGLILSGTARKILLVGAETISRFLDWNDRATCVLFGDGAGAVVIEASTAGAGIRSTALHGDGTKKAHLRLEGGGSLHPPMGRGSESASYYIQMDGPEVFKLAVPAMADATREALGQAGLRLEDVDLFIPTRRTRASSTRSPSAWVSIARRSSSTSIDSATRRRRRSRSPSAMRYRAVACDRATRLPSRRSVVA